MSATGRGREYAYRAPTPAWATHRLLERLALPAGRWVEPGAGGGAIIRAVNAVRSDVLWTAVELEENCRPRLLTSGAAMVFTADYLAYAERARGRGMRYRCAMGNPPFDVKEEEDVDALAFVQASLPIADWVVMLLRLNWLEGGGERTRYRGEWLEGHMPDVYLLPNRPSLGLNKAGKPGTDATAYAWMVWPEGGHDRAEGKVCTLATTPAPERAASRERLVAELRAMGLEPREAP